MAMYLNKDASEAEVVAQFSRKRADFAEMVDFMREWTFRKGFAYDTILQHLLQADGELERVIKLLVHKPEEVPVDAEG